MKALAAAILLVAVAGCDESMDSQNRMKTYGSSQGTSAWPSQGEALQPVQGTVPQGALERERALAEPPPVTPALLQRGRERYDIDCAACHGLAGDGDGIVVARGFPKPRPFGDPQLMQVSAKDMVAQISRGSGAMYSFADRVEPKDRWAIVAYIRALQLATRHAEAAP